MATAVEEKAEELGLTKRQTEQLVDANRRDRKTYVGRTKAFYQDNRKKVAELQYKPVTGTLGAMAGGVIAELNRRKLTGRWIEKGTAQGAALIAEGFALSWAGNYFPGAGSIAFAHVALGAAILSAGWYGDKDNPDPLKVAYEETTYKAEHPAKK